MLRADDRAAAAASFARASSSASACSILAPLQSRSFHAATRVRASCARTFAVSLAAVVAARSCPGCTPVPRLPPECTTPFCTHPSLGFAGLRSGEYYSSEPDGRPSVQGLVRAAGNPTGEEQVPGRDRRPCEDSHARSVASEPAGVLDVVLPGGGRCLHGARRRVLRRRRRPGSGRRAPAGGVVGSWIPSRDEAIPHCRGPEVHHLRQRRRLAAFHAEPVHDQLSRPRLRHVEFRGFRR